MKKKLLYIRADNLNSNDFDIISKSVANTRGITHRNIEHATYVIISMNTKALYLLIKERSFESLMEKLIEIEDINNLDYSRSFIRNFRMYSLSL